MPTVNEIYWGEPYTLYDTYNVRTGTSNLSDPDFTNFPPFVRSNLRGAETPTTGSGTLYSAFLNSLEGWTPESPYPDLSVAYCGVKNPDLTICNVVAIGWDDDIDSHDYANPKVCFKTEPTDIKPIMFLSKKRYSEQKAAHNLVVDMDYNQFYNPYYEVSSSYFYGMYFWAPNYVQMSGSDLWSKRNISGDMAYWRSIGLRTVFGVIYVRYYDKTTEWHNTRGVPTTTHLVTLHWYETQTNEWKATKKVVGAIMTMQIRTNKNGTYGIMTNQDSIVPDVTIGMSAVRECFPSQPDDKLAIYSPVSSVDSYGYCYDFPLFGSRSEGGITNYDDNSARASDKFGVLVGYRESIFKHGSINADSNTYKKRIWLEVDGDSDLEFIRQSAAAFGLFFTDGNASDTGYADLFASGHDTDRWYNDKMCLGVVDNNGYTDGTYTRGLLNATAPNWGWSNTNQSSYDPTKPPVPVMSYDSTTTFNDISNIATLTRRYALTKQDVEDLGSELWQISSDIINNIQNDEWYKYTADVMDTFLVTDPLSCIVSLQKYPMTIPEQSGPVNIKLGKAETSISANITKATAKTYYFTPVPIRPRFGNSFMDYEPYTHFELYVPFCGTTELDPRDILGRTLSVNLVVDFNTGTCVAYVLSDSLVIETINGSLAIDIPVTGVDSTTIASNITQGIINTRNARYTHQFGTLGKVASPSGIVSNIGNVWGSAQTILTSENNAKLSEYELTHQPAQPHVIGSASPVGSWAIDFKCRLLIYYPTGGIVDESKVADSSQPTAFDSTVFEQYQTQIGFATVDPVSALGEHYAHTLVCAEKAILNNVTTPNGRPATEPELQLIRQALQEGVILP